MRAFVDRPGTAGGRRPLDRRPRPRATLAWLALATLALPGGVRAQDADPDNPAPTVLTIRPAGQPSPALKYRIVPERRKLVPGNAAIFYHRAIQMLTEAQNNQRLQMQAAGKAAQESPEMKIAGWGSGPLDRIPRDEARAQLDLYHNSLREVELGAQRATCDWEFDLRTEGFELLLPEVQAMRSLARLVILRARLAVLDGKTDEALHWLQVGFVMARHVGEGPTLIQSLVGVAISSLMGRGLEDLIQQPGTPSLYWALANRARPLIDLTNALEAEGTTLERMMPGLAELDTEPWSVERARLFTDELYTKMTRLVGNIGPDPGAGPPALRDFATKLGLAGLVAKLYPESKDLLIAQGRTPEDVEAMPAVQVVMLATIRQYVNRRDDVFKWTGLPYWQSYEGVNRASQAGLDGKSKLANPLLALFELLLPAINSARVASVRADRQLDALQCIEAIRLYAAGHDGQLPASLEAITEAPAPIDPATGRPFQYAIDGATATLKAPSPPGMPDIPVFRIQYKLVLAR